MPKQNPGITSFSILDPGIENSIPGLQTLSQTKQDQVIMKNNEKDAIAYTS